MLVETKNNLPVPEQLSQHPPSSLDLFRFGIKEYLQILTYHHQVEFFLHQSEITNNALQKAEDETQLRDRRLKQHIIDLDNQSASLESSLSAGAAYLKIYDELSQIGITNQNIFAFYKQCLGINTQIAARLIERSNNNIQTMNMNLAGLKIGTMTVQPRQIVESVFAKEVGNKPPWFKGDGKEWQAYLTAHAFFPPYLQDFPAKYPLLPFQQNVELGITRQEDLPDWLELEDADDQAPSRTIIEEELVKDLAEKQSLEELRALLIKQEENLTRLMMQKHVKALGFLETRRRQVFPNPDSFVNLLICLTGNRGELDIDPKQIMQSKPEQLKSRLVLADEARQRMIANFLESEETALTKECVALWIEAGLCRGGIIKNAQDIIDEKMIRLWSLLFDEVVSTDSMQSSPFQLLRQENKKAFKSLNYDLKPFLEALPANAKSYLDELMKLSQGDSAQSLILEMAGAISISSTQIYKQNENKALQIAIGHFKEFTLKWMTRNWPWAYTRFYQSLLSILKKATELKEDTEDEKDQQSQHEIPIAEAAEVETAVRKSQQGNLADWHLYYATKRSAEGDGLIEISGETIKEREEAFEQFVGKNGIACTIKPPSIIRALERLSSVPQEDEWIRMSKEINGQVFKKIKHPMGMRTFYISDPSERKIIFFIHKKKGWEYGF